jgi:RNA polymerase sigma-70 factor (ECF subfamily)
VQAASKDEAAFDAVYRRYLPLVYRYTLAKVLSVPDAEDITSAVFMDALAGLPQYEEQGKFAAWLFTIARRQVTAHRRRVFRELPRDVAMAGHVPGASIEDRDLVLRALGLLDDERRDALALRFFAELKVNEVADVLGKGESATKMLIHRALVQLRQHLGEAADG